MMRNQESKMMKNEKQTKDTKLSVSFLLSRFINDGEPLYPVDCREDCVVKRHAITSDRSMSHHFFCSNNRRNFSIFPIW